MKWAALAVILASIMPLAGWFRRNPRHSPKVWMLMGFLPFGVGAFHLYMAVISWPTWAGYVKGVEISAPLGTWDDAKANVIVKSFQCRKFGPVNMELFL